MSFLLTSVIDKDSLSTHLKKENFDIELFLITSGYLVRDCNFHSIRINPKEIHLSISGKATSIRETSGDVQGWYGGFDKSFFDQINRKENLESEIGLISSFLYQYPLRLTDVVFRRISFVFDTMTKLHNEHEPDCFLIYSYLLTCIYEIKKVMKESHLELYPAKAFFITKKYNDLLSTHVEKQQNLDFYAKSLEITPNHLNKSIKSVTGKTAIEVLNEVRLEEAKLRLKNTELSVSEIAYQLGFEDSSYFSRFFKKATGVPPKAFRKAP